MTERLSPNHDDIPKRLQYEARMLAVLTMMRKFTRKFYTSVEILQDRAIAREILHIISLGRDAVKRLFIAVKISEVSAQKGLLIKPFDQERFRKKVNKYRNSSRFRELCEQDDWVDELIEDARRRAEACLNSGEPLMPVIS